MSEIPSRIPGRWTNDVPLERQATNQGMLFQWLRLRLVSNTRKQLVGNAKMRVYGIVVSCLIVCFAVFGLSYGGFQLVSDSSVPFAGRIIEVLFDAMFFTLGGMLIFSSGLIQYASLFTAPETRFLLCSPARADQIFASKFQSAVAFSSWAFLVLGAPIFIAYGVTFGVPWYFYPMLPVFFIGYVLLPGSAGALLCLLIVNFFPHKRKQAVALLIGAVAAVGAYWIWQVVLASRQASKDRDAIQGLFDLFLLARGILSPSHWMSQGMLAMAKDHFVEALRPLLLIWANGAAVYLLAAWASKTLYRRGYNRMSTGGDLKRVYGGHWADRVMGWLLFPLNSQMRLLIIKDFRTFRREPAQIGQLLFFGILIVMGVGNMRQFFRADIPLAYQHGLTVLNISAMGLLICAYLARFIYPLISLEGRKFWILGLLPLKRSRILWAKFAFSLTGTLLFGSLVVLSSDLLLGMPIEALILHQWAILMLSLALSGMSVGFSAWMPNFRETDPSKIVAGFGGTVNMVSCLLTLALIVGTMLVPYHLMYVLRNTAGSTTSIPLWVWSLQIPGTLIALTAMRVPMKLGMRTLESMEF